MKLTLFSSKERLEKVILHASEHFEQEWVGSPIRWVNDWIEAYFSKELLPIPFEELSFPTDFIRRVNGALLEIPFGQTVTYKELGDRLNCRGPRAVGNALGRNPYPILLPCHRVLPKTGGIGGFAFGQGIKEELLNFEK